MMQLNSNYLQVSIGFHFQVFNQTILFFDQRSALKLRLVKACPHYFSAYAQLASQYPKTTTGKVKADSIVRHVFSLTFWLCVLVDKVSDLCIFGITKR